MQKDYTVFKIPNLESRENRIEEIMAQPVVFAFYDELNQISEEIEKCRLRNS